MEVLTLPSALVDEVSVRLVDGGLCDTRVEIVEGHSARTLESWVHFGRSLV